MGSLLELFSGVFIFVYCPQDRHNFLFRRKRHGAAHLRTGLLYSLDDFLSRCIHQLMLIRFQCDSHYLTCHKKSRLLFALLKSKMHFSQAERISHFSTTSGDCTLSRVCPEFSRNTLEFRLFTFRTACLQIFNRYSDLSSISNLTFAPRKT